MAAPEAKLLSTIARLFILTISRSSSMAKVKVMGHSSQSQHREKITKEKTFSDTHSRYKERQNARQTEKQT